MPGKSLYSVFRTMKIPLKLSTRLKLCKMFGVLNTKDVTLVRYLNFDYNVTIKQYNRFKMQMNKQHQLNQLKFQLSVFSANLCTLSDGNFSFNPFMYATKSVTRLVLHRFVSNIFNVMENFTFWSVVLYLCFNFIAYNYNWIHFYDHSTIQ